MDDLYAILNVEKDATQEEIKKSYRKLSMRWHPDKNNDSKEASDKFKEISSAYAVFPILNNVINTTIKMKGLICLPSICLIFLKYLWGNLLPATCLVVRA